MALVKCPECNNDISDQAVACPKCGYELKKRKKKVTLPSGKNKWFVVIGVLLLIGGFYLLNSKANATKSYESKFLGISFDYNSGYKVNSNDDGFIYLAKSYSGEQAIIPYILIGRYDDYRYPNLFLTSLSLHMLNEYGSTLTASKVTNIDIGDEKVYCITYTYKENDKTIVDNRYAFVINKKVYMVASKESDNSKDINNLVELIISTMKEGVK